MSSVNDTQSSMRIYDFNTLKKSFEIKDVSNIEEYSLPEENLPRVVNQGVYSCCVACALNGVLEVFDKLETGRDRQLSYGYIYGKHRPADSTAPGMFIEYALQCLLEKGTVPQDIFNLILEMPEIKKVLAGREDLDKIAIPTKIAGYCKVGWQNIDNKIENLKLALLNTKAPIIVKVVKGFPEPHCVMGYGFTKDNRLMYQNSWGETFGRNGRATMVVEDIDAMYMLMDYQVALPFKDVPEDAWFYKSILHMYAAGYVSGRSESEFAPNEPITRAEMCSLLDRILKAVDENNQSRNISIENRFARIEDKLNMV